MRAWKRMTGGQAKQGSNGGGRDGTHDTDNLGTTQMKDQGPEQDTSDHSERPQAPCGSLGGQDTSGETKS